MGKVCQVGGVPLVSVIIPVYNTASYLREMMDSIVGQSLYEIEIIVINDGSTDQSFAILEEYAFCDERIRLFSQSNKGLSITRNVGLEYARGEYIYFMDSDDVLELNALEECYKLSVERHLEVISFDAKILNNNWNLFRDDFYSRSHKLPSYLEMKGIDYFMTSIRADAFRPTVPIYFMSRALIDRLNLRFYPHIIHEDQLFTSQLLVGAESIIYVSKPFFKRRMREDSIMTKPFSWKNIEGYITVFDQLLCVDRSIDQHLAFQMHVSYTLNALLRYVARGLSCRDKWRFARKCVVSYRAYFKPINLLWFLFRA